MSRVNVSIHDRGYLRSSLDWQKKYYKCSSSTNPIRIFKLFYRGKTIANCYVKTDKNDISKKWIYGLIVNPAFRYKGIGSALLKVVEDYYPNHTLCLRPEGNDESLILFYSKNGFKQLHSSSEAGYDEFDPEYWTMIK